MSYSTFHGRLKTTLDGISGINVVYGSEVSKFSGFPAVTLTPAENSDATLDTASNERTYSFLVRVFNEFDTESAETVDAEMMALVDTILDEIDSADYSSSGAFFNPKIAIGGFKFLENEGGWLRIFEFTVELRKKISL